MRQDLRTWKIGRMLQNYYPELRFGFLFLGFAASMLFMYIQFGEALPLLSTHSTATSVVSWLNLLGVKAAAEGSLVFLPNFIYLIVPECTPTYGLVVYYAAVLAYPTLLKKRLIGLVIGTPVIMVVNLLRLISISFIGMARPGMALAVDFYVYPAVFLIIIALSYWFWLDEVVK